MHRVVVPQLFENMEEATIGHWLVAPGQSVTKNQPLCELITEKVTLELGSEVAGTVRQLVTPDKAIVPTGFVIALIGDPNEALPDVAAENSQSLATSPHPSPIVARETMPTRAPQSSGARLRATPRRAPRRQSRGRQFRRRGSAVPDKVLSEDDVKSFAEQP